MNAPTENFTQFVRQLLHQHDGKLTRELMLKPGGFGLGIVPESRAPNGTTEMVCGYCSTGCGLNVHLRDGEAISLTPSTNYPVNLGMACPKGWEALSVLQSDDRATSPMLRDASGELKAIEWPEALTAFCDRFKDIQRRHGNDSVAWIGSGQIPTEELAFLGSLAKFGMGIIHGDGNTRQCMATSAVAYKQSFGFDAPPFTYTDFEESDVIFLVGSNLCIGHPILWERVLRNKHNPEIIVVDPRRTETAAVATQHLAIKPKSDLALFYGLAHILIEKGWIDRHYIDAHTKGFDDFARFVRDFPPEKVSEATGISQDTLARIAETIHNGKRVSFWWTMGVNQSYEGVRAAQSLINLALMTGSMGRPGTGANSITGQCNAMGSRLFSNTTNLLGGRDFLNPAHREKVAAILNLEASSIPDQNSLAYDQIISGIHGGKIKGLWIIATNTAHSWIHQQSFAEAVKKLDFLVVQDMYVSTETAALAHLLLPAAGWGEKDGTFINSERRIGLLKKVARAPGQALADFHIFKLIAAQWGCADLFKEFSSPEAVFQIIKKLSAGQPCDITGIEDYRHLDACGGIQWPLKKGEYQKGASLPAQERRLFEDGRYFHPDGRAHFIFEALRAMPEPTDAEFPLCLLTGRGSVSQWHTQTRTGKSAVLRKLYPNAVYVEINPRDAADKNIKHGEKVTVESRRGKITATAFVSPIIQRGQLFVPMHYVNTNQLTHFSVDPYSRQPSYKACAVRLRLSTETEIQAALALSGGTHD